jgi:erythromycin esterase
MPSVAADLTTAVVALADSSGARAQLRDLIGDRRIVLLGENGHGVGPHTTLKVLLTEYLIDSLGFTTVIFESGYHECDEANDALLARSPVATFRDCLAYVFEHAEALPMFEFVRSARARGASMEIAGADLQPQGQVSLSRPARLRRALETTDTALARATQIADSGLLVASQRGGDSLRIWLSEHGAEARDAFERAVRVIAPAERWRVNTALALLRRGELRYSVDRPDGGVPSAYYAERDHFMARTVSWLADSLDGPRRVVVWMHNDHVRLGHLQSPSGAVPATGRLLRERYPRDVVSIGLFMGEGAVTNNSRAVRSVLPIETGSLEGTFARLGHDASLLVLRGTRSEAVRAWAEAPQRYLRNGLAVDTLVPAAEFDALLFARRASPPTYRIPSP